MKKNGADSHVQKKGTKMRTLFIDEPFLFPPPERKATEAESCQNTMFTCNRIIIYIYIYFVYE